MAAPRESPVAVAGARAKVEEPEDVLERAGTWASRNGCEVLLVDARAVFGRGHVESAVLHARRARDRGTMRARSLPIETLLYLSARRQVADAIRVAGLRKGTRSVAIVLFGTVSIDDVVSELGWRRDDRVLAAAGKPVGLLGIGPLETGTVPDDRTADLVLERVALLDVTK
jgi:KEOPS complex subunit Cgi121